MNRLHEFWDQLRNSFWFLPTCMVFISGLIALALVEVDYRLEINLEAKFTRLLAISAEGAQGMLQAIATSMITVAGVIFSITILILNEASTQYSPRILRNFVRDRSNQVVLGSFLAIFVYCVIVLRSIHDLDAEKFVPSIAVLGAVVFALAGIGVMIFFIHHIAYSIQASTILERAAAETMDELDSLYPQELGQGSDETSYELPRELENEAGWLPIRARQSGYLNHIVPDTLLDFAEKHDTVLRLEYRIGEFVVTDTPLFSIHSRRTPSEKEIEQVLDALSISCHRTIEQDATFGIRQLVDVALKALSPSMNDTTTAIMCVDQLTTLLARLIQRKIESPFRIKDHRLRLIVPRPGFEELLGTCFNQIREHSRGNVAILNRLIVALRTVAPLSFNESRLEALLTQLELLRQTVEADVAFPPDKNRLLRDHDQTAKSIRAQIAQNQVI